MNILFIATKSPWPAVDGGRLLVGSTLAELTAQGHRVTLVAPATGAAENAAPPRGCTARLLPGGPRPLVVSLITSQLRRQPLSIVRHSLPAVRREVARLLDGGGFNVVHAEQLQALAQAEPALARGVPVVLRAQNVESDLWAATARARRFLGLAAWHEARRMARAEAAAVARADAAVALTSEDAARLRELAGGRHVHVARAPFAASLPTSDSRLAGEPALVVVGSEGWLPNRDAVDWFVGTIWPALHRALPGARLHVFGNLPEASPPGIEGHPPPAHSAEVFVPGSVLVVPLRIASGVRIKILEAWARGVPVVATPQAVRGLEAEDGRDLFVASDADGFASALRRLHENRDLAAELIAAGRASLAARHDPTKVTKELVAVYEQAIEKKG